MNADNKKILILRFGALGDIVHTTVIAQALKNKYPNCNITYCVENRYKEIVENCEYVDNIISYNQNYRRNLIYNLQFAVKMREEKFDIIINLTNTPRNNLLSVIANPKKIITYTKNRELHAVEDFYKTANENFEGLTLPEKLYLGVDEETLQRVDNWISKYPKPYFVISPAGSNDWRRYGRIWNKNYWIELCNKLVELYGGTVFITGVKDEANFHGYIAANIKNSVLLSGQTDLKELKCIYKLADLFISGDTGPLHIASALGVKTIGIFGSTDIKNVSQYDKNGITVCPEEGECRFCWQKKCKYLKDDETYTPCMESIKPEKIIDIVKSQVFTLVS